jgi:hypothetical protein
MFNFIKIQNKLPIPKEFPPMPEKIFFSNYPKFLAKRFYMILIGLIY